MDAQEIRNLQEAYMEVVENQQLDETIGNPESRKKLRAIMDTDKGRKGDASKGENPRSKYPSEKSKQALHLLHGSGETGSKGNPVRSRGGTNAPADERVGKGPNRAKNAAYWAGNAGPTRDRGAGNKAKRRAAELNKEEVETDLFDYILEHLVAEGYADTNKAALAIMANMSEEWKQSIVEEVLDEAEGSYGATPKAYGAARQTRMTAKRKPFLKKMLRRTNPANRTPDDSPRKGMTSDDRERARAGAAHGVSTRQDHDYPSEGPGGVTKNPKKLRKQKAMGEHD